MIIQPNKNYLFVCRANISRSVYGATWFEQKAEHLHIPVKVESAGIEGALYGGVQLTRAHTDWADVVFVMEDWMKQEIELYGPKGGVHNLDIPDVFRASITDPELCIEMSLAEAEEYVRRGVQYFDDFLIGRVLFEKVLEARLDKVLV